MSLNLQTLKQAKSFHFLLLIYPITLLLISLITAKKWTIDYLYLSFVLTKLRSFTFIFRAEKALSPGNVINLMSNLSERQYEKGMSIHNTECYIPHLLVYLCHHNFCLT